MQFAIYASVRAMPDQSQKQFSIFVTASGLTNLADGVALLVWAWLASLLTRDPLLIACLPVVLRLPWFLCAVPAGIITDRVDRKRLILAMDVMRALAFGAGALVMWQALPLKPAPQTGLAQPWVYFSLMAIALLVGACEVFRDNGAQTLLPRLVRKENLEKANGRLWSVELIGNSLIGPALGAFLISMSPPAPLAMNAAAYGLAVIFVLSLRGDFHASFGTLAPKQTPNWRREVAQAYRFLRSSPLIFSLAWITGGWNLFFQMFSIAMILHAQENLGFSATDYGLLLSAEAFGRIAAGMFGGHVINRIGPKRCAQFALLASPVCILSIALTDKWASLALIMAIFLFSGMLWNMVSVSYRQRHIPDAMLGRVNSLFRLLAWGLMPVGLILSGMIVRLGEPLLGRPYALSLPIFCAAGGTLILAYFGWRAIGTGFVEASAK